MYWTSHCSTCICFQNSQENEYSQRVYEDYSCHYFLSCRSSSAIIWCPSHSSRRSHKMKMTRLKNDTGRYNHTVIYLFIPMLFGHVNSKGTFGFICFQTDLTIVSGQRRKMNGLIMSFSSRKIAADFSTKGTGACSILISLDIH